MFGLCAPTIPRTCMECRRDGRVLHTPSRGCWPRGKTLARTTIKRTRENPSISPQVPYLLTEPPLHYTHSRQVASVLVTSLDNTSHHRPGTQPLGTPYGQVTACSWFLGCRCRGCASCGSIACYVAQGATGRGAGKRGVGFGLLLCCPLPEGRSCQGPLV